MTKGKRKMETRSRTVGKVEHSEEDDGIDKGNITEIQNEGIIVSQETSNITYSNDTNNPSIDQQIMTIVMQKDKQIDELKSVINQMMINSNTNQQDSMPQTSNIQPGTNTCNNRGSDPIKFLPQFTWDTKDLNEAKRFVTAFKNLTTENNWTETHARTAFESKLAGKGRTKYYEGLGNVEGITFQARLMEFERLFSRELKPSQGQELFWSCKQHAGETIISYKLRLISLGNAYKRGFHDNTLFHQLLFQQFIKGVREKIRLELVKAKTKNFEEAVTLAMELEEIEMTYADQGMTINSLCSEDKVDMDEIQILKAELEQTKFKLCSLEEHHKKNGAVRANRERGEQLVQQCDRQNYINACTLCNKPGHDSSTCYMRLNIRRVETKRTESLKCRFTKEDGRPVVQLRVCGRPVKALVDSGAQFTVLGGSFISESDRLVSDCSVGLITPITGGQIQARCAVVDMQLSTFKFKHRVCITELNRCPLFDMIIGCEFLNKYKATINMNSNTMEFQVPVYTTGTSKHAVSHHVGWNGSIQSTGKRVSDGETKIIKPLKLNDIRIPTVQKEKIVEIIRNHSDILIKRIEDAPLITVAVSSANAAISVDEILKSQKEDAQCIRITKNLIGRRNDESIYAINEDGLLVKRVVPAHYKGWKYRVVVPSKLRPRIMSFYHDGLTGGHLSARITCWKIRMWFTWHWMNTEIREFVKTCDNCQRRIIPRIKVPYQHVEHLSNASKKDCEMNGGGWKLMDLMPGERVLHLDSTSYTGENQKTGGRYGMPYRVIRRAGEVNYKIRNVDAPNDEKIVHINTLKRYHPRLILDDQEGYGDRRNGGVNIGSDNPGPSLRHKMHLRSRTKP